MPLYRKKPIVIEAFQMTQEARACSEPWPNWLQEAWNKRPSEQGSLYPQDFPKSDGKDQLMINTLEGAHLVSWDDFIIQGVHGEIYPCKPDIFEATYDRVED